MHPSLTHPWSPKIIALATAAAIVLLGAYCLLYNAAVGRAETAWNAFTWPIINVVPFMLAFESGKRDQRTAFRLAMLTSACAASIALDFAMSSSSSLLFEATRRVPAFVLVLALWWSGHWIQESKLPQQTAPLPLLPGQIDWVQAAGNYVLLHGSGRRLCHRATLSAVEATLMGHGFVRVHRSHLVRAEAVARTTSRDVFLRDGTRIALSSRHRPALPH